MNILIVVDMQNDFVSGALGTPEARRIVPAAAERVAAGIPLPLPACTDLAQNGSHTKR